MPDDCAGLRQLRLKLEREAFGLAALARQDIKAGDERGATLYLDRLVDVIAQLRRADARSYCAS